MRMEQNLMPIPQETTDVSDSWNDNILSLITSHELEWIECFKVNNPSSNIPTPSVSYSKLHIVYDACRRTGIITRNFHRYKKVKKKKKCNHFLFFVTGKNAIIYKIHWVTIKTIVKFIKTKRRYRGQPCKSVGEEIFIKICRSHILTARCPVGWSSNARLTAETRLNCG